MSYFQTFLIQILMYGICLLIELETNENTNFSNNVNIMQA